MFVLVSFQQLYSHCQVPCGIYDDPVRVKLMKEHIATIEKAMKQITALSEKKPVNYNQVVRWVMNKESHAEELVDIVTYYFMAQRLKPVASSDEKAYASYKEKLELLHLIIVNAMKAKQTTDLSYVEKLKTLVTKFAELYFEKKK